MKTPCWTRRLEERRCPYCGKTLDSISVLEGDAPRPRLGDLAVCFGCTEVMQFGKERFEKLSAAEFAALDWNELAEVTQSQNAIRAFLKTKGN
jgi:hypothetical protein